MADTTGKPISCRAAVSWEPNQKLSIETIEVAPPKAGEVRVHIKHTGVCHTDEWARQGFMYDDSVMSWPCILGHEGSGIVESIGEGVTTVKPGDHVIPMWLTQCKECADCKSPRSNLCAKIGDTQAKGVMPDGTSRFTCKGKTVYHYMGTSTFSEYTVLAEIAVCKINEAAPLEKVCLIGCGISTGYGAALNAAKVEKGSTCAVWGLGAVGMAAVMGCKAAGAAKIYGVDTNPAKAEKARQVGMTDFVNPNDYNKPIQDVMVEKTGGGLDFAFEAIGNVVTMRAALESCRKAWGVCCVIGVALTGQEISTRPFNLLTGRRWIGTVFGGWKGRDDVPRLVERYMRKEMMLDEFISHTMPVDKINEAFDLMLTGKSVRSVINF